METESPLLAPTVAVGVDLSAANLSAANAMVTTVTESSDYGIPAIDPATFDPDGYEWIPVPRRSRADGWTPQCQRQFIEHLSERGSVEQAARAVGKTVQSAYALRRAREAEGFDAAWRAALDNASKRLLDDAFERALFGSSEPVFDRDGNIIGRKHRQSDKLMMFLLRAYMPDRFRYAHHDVRGLDEPRPAPLPRLIEALTLIGPQRPEAPHLTMDPETLAARVSRADYEAECAEAAAKDDQAPQAPPREPDGLPTPEPIDADFERRLADAKREMKGKPPLTDAEWDILKRRLLA